MSLFANYRSQFVHDRPGRYLEQTVRINCRSFLSQVRPSKLFIGGNSTKTSAAMQVTVQLIASDPSNGDNSDNLYAVNCSHSVDRLNKNDKKATSQNGDNENLYLHSLKKIWCRNYYAAHPIFKTHHTAGDTDSDIDDFPPKLFPPQGYPASLSK